MGVKSHFLFLTGVLAMNNVKHRAEIETGFAPIWKKSTVDDKGRCVLPKKLRQKLDLNGHSSILWISAKRKNGKKNEFLIAVGIKND